jgi:hypothetical protein
MLVGSSLASFQLIDEGQCACKLPKRTSRQTSRGFVPTEDMCLAQGLAPVARHTYRHLGTSSLVVASSTTLTFRFGASLLFYLFSLYLQYTCGPNFYCRVPQELSRLPNNIVSIRFLSFIYFCSRVCTGMHICPLLHLTSPFTLPFLRLFPVLPMCGLRLCSCSTF